MQHQRPLGRRLIKLASSLLGPKWSHAHAWIPHLKLEKAANGAYEAITYRDQKVASLNSSEILRNAAGMQICIVGSGPSVLQNNLASLEPHSALLLNGAIAQIGTHINAPLAVAVEDERFVWRHETLMKEKIAAGTVCLFSPAVIRALCEVDPGWLTDKRIVLLDNIRKPYRRPRRSFDDLRTNSAAVLNQAGTAGFSREPDHGVFQGGSVAVSAFQFAIYAQPEIIGLVGIDVSNADQPRFYESRGDIAPSGLQRASVRIREHVLLALEECRRLGIEVENYSNQSILTSCGLPYNSRFSKEAE